MALFKINNIVKITNRGYVLTGIIVEGDFTSGDLIQLDLNGNMIKLKIKSIEGVRHNSREAVVGLMLGPLENNIRMLLESMMTQTILITGGHVNL
jgi:hypothetical protein